MFSSYTLFQCYCCSHFLNSHFYSSYFQKLRKYQETLTKLKYFTFIKITHMNFTTWKRMSAEYELLTAKTDKRSENQSQDFNASILACIKLARI